MSHGTGSGYVVVSAAELNRRAVDGARLRCRALQARVPSPALREPLHGSVAAWQRYEAALAENPTPEGQVVSEWEMREYFEVY